NFLTSSSKAMTRRSSSPKSKGPSPGGPRGKPKLDGEGAAKESGLEDEGAEEKGGSGIPEGSIVAPPPRPSPPPMDMSGRPSLGEKTFQPSCRTKLAAAAIKGCGPASRNGSVMTGDPRNVLKTNRTRRALRLSR